LEDKLWELCQTITPLDPSRLISCDGSGDLGGRLPVNSLHYPGYNCPTHREKPITIGEMGSMYFSTPDNVCSQRGARVLRSMDNRLEAVARDAFRNLIGQRKWAAQVCVFNLVWYGLEPLPFIDRMLTYDDYTTPGIKPSRITPYLRTLNAGAQDNLPEYIGNPVFKWTKKAYKPVRFFIEDAPHSGWTGEEISLKVSIFNDNRDPMTLRLAGKTYHLDACTYTEDTVIHRLPDTRGRHKLKLKLKRGKKTVHKETLVFFVDKRRELRAPPHIAYGCPAPYDTFTRPKELRHLFAHAFSFTLKKPVKGYCFDEYLPFNAIPFVFTGDGRPVAIFLQDEKQVICGVDLNGDDPKHISLMSMLNTVLTQKNIEPRPAYFIGKPDGDAAAMLDELRVEYEPAGDDKSRLLIVDGCCDYDLRDAHGFPRVFVMNPIRTPGIFSGEFDIVEKKAFHLKSLQYYLYGNNLYGLSVGQEAPLAEKLMLYRPPWSAVLGLPDIDWRQWNQNPEALKTVAVLRSEIVDNSRYAAVVWNKYAGSEIILSQISLNVQNRKAKNILTRLLSYYGAKINLTSTGALDELLTAGVYSNQINRMLWNPNAGQSPGLNRMENCTAWRVTDGRETGGAYAVFIHSPQDRTDLLLNPDTVDMSIDRDMSVTLNGKETTLTSIELRAGWNTLVLNCREDGPMPKVKFARTNKKKLDLTFGLYGGEVKTLRGDIQEWRSPCDQRPGVEFTALLPASAEVKGIYMDCAAAGENNDRFTPYCFTVEADGVEVFRSDIEDRMSYPEGRVFIALPGVRARSFRFVLVKNALKPWVVSDLTFLT
jgi:hypothetical protein